MNLRLKFALIMAMPLALIYLVLNTMEFMELARTTLSEERTRAKLLVELQADEVSAFARLAELRASGILATTSAVDMIEPERLDAFLQATAAPEWIAGIGLLDKRQAHPVRVIVTGPGARGATPVPADHSPLSRAINVGLEAALGDVPDGWQPIPPGNTMVYPLYMRSDDPAGISVIIAIDAPQLTELVATENEVADPWVVTDSSGRVVFGHPIDRIGKPIAKAYPDVPNAEMARATAAIETNDQGSMEISEPRYWIGWTTVHGSPWRLLLPIDMRTILTPVWAAVGRAAFIAVIGIIVNLLVITMLAGLFTRPIRRLAEAFRRVRAGQFTTRVPVKTRDELGHLADGFNQMTSQLSDLLDARTRAETARVAVEAELSIAKEMQESLLPADAALPDTATCRVRACTQPAKEVGGDFYDAWMQDDTVWFTVADVSGKGVGAGLFMAVASTILHGLRDAATTPSQVLQTLNRRLLEDGSKRAVFLTMFLGRIDPDGTVTYASAGHLPAIKFSATSTDQVAPATGPPLAMMPDMDWPDGTVHLAPGEHLLVYSDGAIEAHYDDGSMVEIEGLAALARATAQSDTPDVLQAVLTQLTALQTDGQFDDITLMAVSRAPDAA